MHVPTRARASVSGKLYEPLQEWGGCWRKRWQRGRGRMRTQYTVRLQEFTMSACKKWRESLRAAYRVHVGHVFPVNWIRSHVSLCAGRPQDRWRGGRREPTSLGTCLGVLRVAVGNNGFRVKCTVQPEKLTRAIPPPPPFGVACRKLLRHPHRCRKSP